MKKQILLRPILLTVGLILALGFVLGLDPSGTIQAQAHSQRQPPWPLCGPKIP